MRTMFIATEMCVNEAIVNSRVDRSDPSSCVVVTYTFKFS